MVNHIDELFPSLQKNGYHITSPQDDSYNCIAWAVGRTSEWWWPGGAGPMHWPEDVPREETVTAFRDVFATLGYVVCEDNNYEPDVEKVALFADGEGIPTHVARQLPSGRWTSKLGFLEDIEHELYDLEGAIYGSVVLLMKRALRAEQSKKTEA